MTKLKNNVAELGRNIAKLECEVMDAMKRRYTEFTIMSVDAASFVKKTQAYSEQIDDLIQRIDAQVPASETYLHLLSL